MHAIEQVRCEYNTFGYSITVPTELWADFQEFLITVGRAVGGVGTSLNAEGLRVFHSYQFGSIEQIEVVRRRYLVFCEGKQSALRGSESARWHAE